ncbi:MAG: ATP-binding protein, partial [Clostridiales bacterium]|nr:ATP-binding protein [Clostridiales bacterium]
MIQNKKQNIPFQLALIILIVVFLSVSLFMLCYYFDNKFTAKGPNGVFGAFILSEEMLKEYPFFHLLSGWEIYRNKLLAPEDFKTQPLVPDEYVFIGQYRGFEGSTKLGKTNNPHGSATYRMTLSLPENLQSYTLELPEIYSAYRLYINQELVMQLGNPDPDYYQPLTGNTKVVFQGSGLVEILFAVTDSSHFYSGMLHPPAFGLSHNIDHLLTLRFALRIGVAALSICVGFFYFVIWFSLKKNRKNLFLLSYTCLCFCYMIYIFYPVIKSISFNGMGWYAIERISFPLFLLLAIHIQNNLYQQYSILSKA